MQTAARQWIRLLIPLAGAGALFAADHPTLVSIESAVCSTCHEEIFEKRPTVHAPAAEDCLTCHEMSVSDNGTQVSLMEAEPSLCVMCHEDLAPAVEAELEVPHAPVTDSCLYCHDPHASEAATLLSAPMVELCGGCHDPGDLDETHDGQLTDATDCTSCHEPHGSAQPRLLAGTELHRPFEDGSCNGCHRKPFGTRVRLRTRGERLCEACHGVMDELSGPNGSVHAALKGEGGRAGCLGCHDPHMTNQRRLLRAEGPGVCEACHGEIVASARAETGHYPAAEDCTNCHQPHAAEHPSLLEAETGEICQACHDVSDEDLKTAHLGADPARLECISCHTPHGSGHQKLLAKNLHPPLEDGCETCHEGSFDQLMEDGQSSLCLICHDDIGEIAASAPVPHGALEVATCADCHNPHASAQTRLVKAPGGEVCVACHDDQAAGQGEVAHAVIDLLGCQACHEPHGGEQEKLLRTTDVSELCLSCHDADRVSLGEDQSTVTVLDRFEVSATAAAAMASLQLTGGGQQGHPIRDHRVLGTPTEQELKANNVESDYVGEMTCLTCHDPHKGRSSLILRWDARSSVEACGNCHKKK